MERVPSATAERTLHRVCDAAGALHVIFSVPTMSRAETFVEHVRGQLTDHEALMIDEEDDPERVAAFFAEKQVARAACDWSPTTRRSSTCRPTSRQARSSLLPTRCSSSRRSRSRATRRARAAHGLQFDTGESG